MSRPRGMARPPWPLGLLVSPSTWRRWRERQVPAVIGWHQLFYRCLGGVSLVLLALQLASGLMLLAHYQPQTAQALAGLAQMEAEHWWGWPLRRMHAVGGNLLVLFVSLHMFRVWWRGAFRQPRRFYWLSGYGLWLACLAMLLSGSLLPATQGAWRGWGRLLALWGLGAPDPGQALGGLYALHLGLPWLMLVALVAHLAMIRRLGLAEPL